VEATSQNWVENWVCLRGGLDMVKERITILPAGNWTSILKRMKTLLNLINYREKGMSGISIYRTRSLFRCYGTWQVQDICSLMSVGNEPPSRLLCCFSLSSETFLVGGGGGFLNVKRSTTDFPLFSFRPQLLWWLKHPSGRPTKWPNNWNFFFFWMNCRAPRRGQLSVFKGISTYNARRAETVTREGLHCRHVSALHNNVMSEIKM
jgi:hypothetical protein